jgi:transcriptional regulator with XRE-family HTH domain
VRVLALSYYRQDAKLSQQGLGDKVGISQSEISRFERGHRTPNDDVLARLAEVLNVHPAFRLLLPVEIREQKLDGLVRP